MRIRFLLAIANALCVKLLLSAKATQQPTTFLRPRPHESNINMHGPNCIITNASLALSLQTWQQLLSLKYVFNSSDRVSSGNDDTRQTSRFSIHVLTSAAVLRLVSNKHNATWVCCCCCHCRTHYLLAIATHANVFKRNTI